MKRPSLSFSVQRAINGVCVAWKPDNAPQEIVKNKSGQIGTSPFTWKFCVNFAQVKPSPSALIVRKNSIGSVALKCETTNPYTIPTDIKSNNAPKSG